MTSPPPPSDDHTPGPDPFPVHPGTPADEPATGARPAGLQPSSIATAVKLMYAGAALSLLGLVYTVATLGSLRDSIRESALESDPSLSADAVDAAVAVGIGVGVVSALIGAGLWIWMAWANGRGLSWARIVATVLGGVNVVFCLFTLATGGPAVTLVLTLVNLVLAAVILVLLWRKESSAYYEAVRA